MANINIDKININYKLEGNGNSVVLLHGWGQNILMMDYIFNHLKSNFKVLSLDFPGFGESDKPLKPFSVEDYMELLHKLLIKLKIENPILIGHSFGCRVAIKYANKYSVKKMILTGAAGIKPKRNMQYHLKVNTYKFVKKILKTLGLNHLIEKLNIRFGSSDYKNTVGVMRETFIKVVNDDVSDILENIACPVLLVWGEKDEAVDLSMGKLMESQMKNAAMVVFENDNHFAYFNQWQRFNLVIDAMLKEDMK